MRYQIHFSTMEAVSLMFSGSAVTQFSVMIFDATRAVCDVESISHPWKQFRWWFLSPQRLSFWLWFLSPQELYALSNPHVNRGSWFVGDFWLGNDSVFNDDFRVRGDVCDVESMRHSWKQFRWWFLSLERLFLLSNWLVNRGSSFVDVFWVCRGCFCCRFDLSPVEAVSLMFSECATTQFSMMVSESAATQFSIMIFESTRGVCIVESTSQPWKQFRWCFLSGQRLSFNDDFSVRKGCTRCRILVSTVDADSLTISD
jgi:hypothetical protein